MADDIKQSLEKILRRISTDWNNYYYPRIEWHIRKERWISALRLSRLRDKHSGQRCFIIGNGPSLNKMDLKLLKNEVTFGLNRIYLLFPILDFYTTYYIAVNVLVVKQCIHDITRLPMIKFLSWYTRDLITFDDRTIFIFDYYSKKFGFSLQPIWQVWEGATVTYVALQLAYYMGFQQVILIGVDHSFKTQGEPHKIITSNGDDLDHFDKGYFGKGFQWQLPDLETSEKAYRLAKTIYETDGRQILDATIGGKLQVFPKEEYYSLF